MNIEKHPYCTRVQNEYKICFLKLKSFDIFKLSIFKTSQVPLKQMSLKQSCKYLEKSNCIGKYSKNFKLFSLVLQLSFKVTLPLTAFLKLHSHNYEKNLKIIS